VKLHRRSVRLSVARVSGGDAHLIRRAVGKRTEFRSHC
jgi:hypothetical protein